MTDFVNLFGEAVTIDRGKIGKRKEPTPSGYAARPGTGPEGETCRTCKHLVRRHYARVYLKCGLTEAAWTGGRKTDVLARSPSCAKWEPA